MANVRSPLPVLRVAEPCGESWKEMTGDDKVRFCPHCQKHVHNLSAMNHDEAERLVCAAAGSLCVRFNRAADGQVLTLDYQARPKPKRNKWLWPLTAVAALAAAVAGASYRPKPTVLMGMMVRTPLTTTPPCQGGVSPGPPVRPSTPSVAPKSPSSS